MQWLIVLPQLPASPSTLRVMVWRRMRDAGALGLQNGVWMLPNTDQQVQFIQDLRTYLAEHDASSFVFKANTVDEELEKEMLERLRVERDEEYAEFIERCNVLLDDLEQETQQGKFSYAELEEAEVDLGKLEGWWQKCTARDFVGGHRRQEALEKLDACRNDYQGFANAVYAHHGVGTPPATQRNSEIPG